MIIKILHENKRFLLNTKKQKETHRTNLPEKPLKTIYQKICAEVERKEIWKLLSLKRGRTMLLFNPCQVNIVMIVRQTC